MAKKYNIPESDEAKMVEEPAVALRYSASNGYVPATHVQECSFDADDAPLQFSVEEVKSILSQNREEYKNGQYHTMAEVDRIMDSWC